MLSGIQRYPYSPGKFKSKTVLNILSDIRGIAMVPLGGILIVLSQAKIPHVRYGYSRFFRNFSYGRDSRVLLTL